MEFPSNGRTVMTFGKKGRYWGRILLMARRSPSVRDSPASVLALGMVKNVGKKLLEVTGAETLIWLCLGR